MKKSDRKSLLENLDKALDPPALRRKPALASHLAEYDDAEPDASSVPLSPSGGQTPSHGLTPSPIAPARDFNKRANSIERDAMPQGMFPGTSKKLYDALYIRTRGAIKPARTLRATKKDLSVWSGIKNRKTIDAHLRYFDMVGLVRRQWLPGQNEGYQFEVVLPEEIGQGDRPPVVVRPVKGSDQKSVRGSDQKSGSGGQTQTVENQDTFGPPQTIFKTSEKNLDDEATRRFVETLKQVERELTGKNASNSAQWTELAEVLTAELRIAAARTTVSSMPAFLSEHLRRRLWKLDKKTAQAEGRETPDQVVREPSSVPAGLVCPDCSNSGWWYPEGSEKGVARCTHIKLQSVPAEQETD